MKKLSFCLIQLPAYLLSFLPYTFLHLLGRGLGSILYYTFPKFRKRSLSNLSLAKSLNLSDKEKIKILEASVAKEEINLDDHVWQKDRESGSSV